MQDNGPVPLIDTHAHVFRRDLPPLRGREQEYRRDATIEDYVGELDRAGVRFGVVSAASFLGNFVDYTLEALSKHSRLHATAIVPPDVSMSRLRELDAAGFRGIRLAFGPMASPPDLKHEGYGELMSKLVSLDWHVHVYARREHLPAIVRFVESCGTKLVIDHFGARDDRSGLGSESCSEIIRAMRNGRTWVKLSAPYWSPKLDHKALAEAFLDAGGPRRLLWGSDWPFMKLDGQMRYRQAVQWLSEWIEDPELRRQIDRNAIDLYRFEQTDATQ